MKKSFSFIFLLFILLAPLSAIGAEKPAASTSQESGVSIFMKGSTLQLQNATVGEKVEILSIVGVRVFQKKIESTNQDYELDLPKGYYIVKIGTIVRKIAVK
ncbi:MAG TPA: T9SS type A sorting domain-containing protein [Bacteroidales bacterium]